MIIYNNQDDINLLKNYKLCIINKISYKITEINNNFVF